MLNSGQEQKPIGCVRKAVVSMKWILIKLLLKLYRSALRDFVKISVGEEFNYYKFGTPADVVRLLKYLQTCQVLWYYEAKTKEERQAVRGASMILQIMVDSHKVCNDIVQNESDEYKQLEKWEMYRKKHRTT